MELPHNSETRMLCEYLHEKERSIHKDVHQNHLGHSLGPRGVSLTVFLLIIFHRRPDLANPMTRLHPLRFFHCKYVVSRVTSC